MLKYSAEFKEKIAKQYLCGVGSTCYLGKNPIYFYGMVCSLEQ